LNDFDKDNKDGKNRIYKYQIELYAIETLPKLQYCSEETTMFLLLDNAANSTHSSYLQYNL